MFRTEIFKTCSNVVNSFFLCVITKVNLAVELYPGIWIAPIVQGTIAGFAGQICLDCVRGSFSLQQTPLKSEMMHPGFIWRSALFSTALYYWAVHWVDLLTQTEGLALLRLILV